MGYVILQIVGLQDLSVLWELHFHNNLSRIETHAYPP